MQILTERPIAVFDLDGVIIQNPFESLGQNTITDSNYWENHWLYPEKATFNDEIVELAHSMLRSDTHVVFLTARPSKYRSSTETLLKRAGLEVGQGDLTQRSFRPRLVMIPSIGIPQSGAAWKRDTIQGWIDQGGKVLFMVEDYKPNAEFVREIIPVLLYERKKQSRHFVTR
jgi:hypothetical protein